MNGRILVTALVAGLAVLSSACSAVGSKGSGSFTEADSGKTFATSPGATLDIHLKGNYTTGYLWNIVSCDKNIVQPASSRYVPSQPQLGGSGGIQSYTFNIVGKGQTVLKLAYYRVWEKGVAPAQTFALQIDSR